MLADLQPHLDHLRAVLEIARRDGGEFHLVAKDQPVLTPAPSIEALSAVLMVIEPSAVRDRLATALVQLDAVVNELLRARVMSIAGAPANKFLRDGAAVNELHVQAEAPNQQRSHSGAKWPRPNAALSRTCECSLAREIGEAASLGQLRADLWEANAATGQRLLTYLKKLYAARHP
jgi:hypothetical protein